MTDGQHPAPGGPAPPESNGTLSERQRSALVSVPASLRRRGVTAPVSVLWRTFRPLTSELENWELGVGCWAFLNFDIRYSMFGIRHSQSNTGSPDE
jgi:hypothetical protein